MWSWLQEQLAEVQSDLLQLKRSHCGNAVCQVDGNGWFSRHEEFSGYSWVYGEVFVWDIPGVFQEFDHTCHMLRWLYVIKKDEFEWAHLMLPSCSLIWFQGNLTSSVFKSTNGKLVVWGPVVWIPGIPVWKGFFIRVLNHQSKPSIYHIYTYIHVLLYYIVDFIYTPYVLYLRFCYIYLRYYTYIHINYPVFLQIHIWFIYKIITSPAPGPKTSYRPLTNRLGHQVMARSSLQGGWRVAGVESWGVWRGEMGKGWCENWGTIYCPGFFLGDYGIPL